MSEKEIIAVHEHGPVSRSGIDALLMDKLPEALAEDQKKKKVHYLVGKLRKEEKIETLGSRAQPQWVAVADHTSKQG